MSSKQRIPVFAERATRKLFSRVITELARTLGSADLSLSQAATLHLVDQRRRMRINELSRELALSPSATSRLVDGLVRKGLCLRRDDAHDRRAKTIELSAKGSAFVQRASEARVEIILATMRERVPKLVLAGVLKAMERVDIEGV